MADASGIVDRARLVAILRDRAELVFLGLIILVYAVIAAAALLATNRGFQWPVILATGLGFALSFYGLLNALLALRRARSALDSGYQDYPQAGADRSC